MRVEEENERCGYNWQSLGDGARESIGSRANAKRTSAAAERRLMERVGGGQNDGRTRLEEDRGGHGRDGLKWSMISMGERGGGEMEAAALARKQNGPVAEENVSDTGKEGAQA